MRLEGILAQMRLHLEFSHASSEGRRGAGGKGRHVDGGCLGGYPLAGGHVVASEEVVEDRAGGTALLYVHQAHNLGRVHILVSGLLRDNDPAAQHRAVVHGTVHLLPLEFNVGGSFHLLAPEAVEGGETGVFKAHQVGPVVNLEGGRYGLSHHYGGTAQAQAQEDIGIARRGGLGR